MKNSSVFFLLLFFCSYPFLTGQAQDFQRFYGTGLDNSFSKVIKDGSNYYVLGQNESTDGSPQVGTITRLDANGQHQWTLEPDFACVWNDAIRIPNGDLLVVGSTLPFDATSNSLIGLVTPAGGGNFTWLRSYNEPGTIRNAFTRIVQNSLPENPLFPYYILGTQSEFVNQANSDVAILNMNSNGVFNWKKKFDSANDDKFYNDLEVLSDGNMLLAGNAASDVIFEIDNAAEMVTGAQSGTSQLTFNDVVESSNGDIYAVGLTAAGVVHLMLFDADLIFQWDASIPGLTSISQVWERSFGELYLTGRGTFGGNSRGVIIKFDEPSGSVDWVQYLSAGNSISGESSWPMPNGQIAYTDGRILPTGFGQQDAFISLSDFQLNTCQVDVGNNFGLFTHFPLPNSPLLPLTFFQEIPSHTDHVIFQALDWQQAEVCSTVPCTVDFTYQVDCGVVTFHGQSGFLNPTSWQWSFAGGSPSNSTSQDPMVSFLECDSYKVCLVVTGGDPQTSCSVCHTVTITDNVPPVALCLGIGVVLDANCHATITPSQIDGGSTDDCLIQSMSVSPNVLTGCGLFPVTLTVTDWCGNTATCATMVQTIEDIPPMIRCPSNITVTSSSPAPCSSIVNNLQPTNVSDNCSTPTVTYSITGVTNGSGVNDASGVTFNQGTSTVIYTATDACGNTATCEFTVTVLCGNQSTLFKCGMAVVTCFSGWVPLSTTLAQANGPVLALVDVRNHATAPLGINWYAVSSSPSKVLHLPNWESKDMGQIFGVTIDNNYNVYTSSTTMYGRFLPATLTSAVYGNVYKIDAVTGIPTVFVTLSQNLASPAGLGDVWFDDQSSIDQIYVSNFFDGIIYRYDLNQNLLGTYDFPGVTFGTPTPGFVPLGERVWAVATHNGRLYFSVWNEDRTRPLPTMYNQIWSVQLNAAGAPISGTEFMEKSMPDLITVSTTGPVVNNYSSPVSDISFSENGTMLIAERSMPDDFGNAAVSPGGQAHLARIIELSGPGWSTEKIFYVGNTNSLENSAGGIDYGYASFDPSVSPAPLLCDSMIWGTGDALRYPGFNVIPDASQPLLCSGGINDKVYGLTGVPEHGNSNLPSPAAAYVKNSSIYIDLDNNICHPDKSQIGDVDVFKCITCQNAPMVPCDSLMVMSESVSAPNDSFCCYSIDFKHLSGNITQICANLPTSGWIFNTASLSVATGYTWTISSNQICISHPGGIPFGNLQNVLTYCLAETTPNAPPVQQIIFDWISPGIVVCKDTIVTECNPPTKKDSCLVISNMHADCTGENDLEYCVVFNVTNLNNTPAYGLILGSLPPGFAYGDCGCGGSAYGTGGYLFSGFPVIPANASQFFCVKIISTYPIQVPTNICFKASLELGQQCCTSTKDWCVELKPCCNPCETTFIAVEDNDECCYSIDFNYDCDFGYFSHIDFDILTPGVSFGSHANDPTWSFCSTPTLNHVCIKPTVGIVQPGTYNDLFSFCLTDINQPSEIPQKLHITYWATNINGKDIIACDTILTFNCEYKKDTCVFTTNENIECIADSMKYLITVTVQNLAVPNFTATNLAIIAPGISPNPVPLVPPLNNDGTTRTVTFCYTPNPWPDADGQLILVYRLKNFTQDTCCNGNQSFIDTLILPDCCNENRIIINSGWDNQNSSLIPIGGTDMDVTNELDWRVVSDPLNPPPAGGRPADVVPPFGGWDLPFSGSQWISADPNWYNSQLQNPPTIFNYELKFDLPTSFSNVHLSMQLRADELIRRVTLNNHLIYQHTPPQINGGFTGPPLHIANSNAAFFNPQQNKLLVEYSDESGTVTGINMAGSVSFCNDTCACGTFSDMAMRFERGPGTPLTCGGNPVFLSCPPIGYNYTFTGKFLCQGHGCPVNAPVDWELVGPNGGTIASGTEIGNPYLGISFPNSFFQQSGVYNLVLTGHCGSQACPCVIKFLFDPPCINVCPCTSQDLLDFSTRVERGFAQIFQLQTCEACFTPIALNDCETVEWHLNTTDEPVIGTSEGGETFCYAFSGPGDYNVVMNVSKKKDDGSNCDKQKRTQSISLACVNLPECINSVFDNPGFSEGAVKGGLNTGGHSNGWKASSGNPKLLESQIGSLDGWTVLLSGNIDTSDILSTVEPICLAKIEGMISVRIAVNDSAPGGIRGKPSKEQFDIELYQGEQVSPNSCNSISCFELASVSLRGLPHNEWLELQIPYDLRNWDALDTCGGFPGVLVRPAMYVTNPFSSDQGGKETFTFVQIDNFCLGGTIVAVEEPVKNNDISIFPNPTTGELILKFTGPTTKSGVIEIFDLYGRLMLTEKLSSGKDSHSISMAELPSGVYFVKVLEKGIPVNISKVIKQ